MSGTESLTWHPAAEKPDSDVTVLLHVPTSDSEPVWPGYWDGRDWLYAEGARVGRPVKAWCDIPKGMV